MNSQPILKNRRRINFLYTLLLAVVFLPSCGGGSAEGSNDISPSDPLLVEEEMPVVQRKPIFKRRLALFVVDFPDNRQMFPPARDIEKNLEEGVVRDYFSDISYGQFTYEIDSFGPFTHQDNFTSLYPDHVQKVFSINTVNISGFDADRYDLFILVTLSDYEFEAGVTIPKGYLEFRVNGEVVNSDKRVVVNPLFAGCRKRDCSGDLSPEDKFQEKDFSGSPFTLFQRIFIHEFIHSLGIWEHANSRTNGSRFDYEEEIPNNRENLNYDYGNSYDIMGGAPDYHYGYNLNVGYRDWLGWLKPPRKTVIKDYGCFTTTVNPINSVDYTVAVEIVIPEKGDRYYLEVRDFLDKWDRRGHTSEVQKIVADNRQGIMVNKKADDTADMVFTPTLLLDMSPSPNRTEKGYEGEPDIRDVVLKPGREYEYDAPDVRLWDVIPEGNGSFSVKIMVKRPDDEPHKSCAGY